MNVITAPVAPTSSPQAMATYHYLLLGELRLLLEEPADSEETHLWLLAVLDRLLARLPRESGDKAGFSPEDEEPRFSVLGVHPPWVQKLKRLRDRVAHRAPFQMLANEIRCDLRQLFDRQFQRFND